MPDKENKNMSPTEQNTDHEYDPDIEQDKQTMFSNLRRLSGRQLTEAQELRIARLIDLYGMSGIIEFRYMTVMWEYYLSQNKELLDHHATYIENLLNVQCADSIADKLETVISKKLTETVVEQSEKRAQEIATASNFFKYGIFLLTFSIFGVLFFVTGLLTHGKGLPAWIDYAASGSDSMTDVLIGLVLGIPVGWVLWIGIGIISGYCVYQYIKINDSFNFKDFLSENKWKLFFAATSLLIIWGIISWL